VTLVGENVTPVAILLQSLGIPFVLATASDRAGLARHQILANARNLGKPTDLSHLVLWCESLQPIMHPAIHPLEC